jgi:hypothetical protein
MNKFIKMPKLLLSC